MTYSPPDFHVRTFAFSCQIVRLYKLLTNTRGFPFGIARQILRSGTSIGANIEEGRAASSRRDLAARSAVALREAGETKYCRRLIRATDLVPPVVTEGPLQEVDELVAILTVSVRRLRAGVATTRQASK